MFVESDFPTGQLSITPRGDGISVAVTGKGQVGSWRPFNLERVTPWHFRACLSNCAVNRYSYWVSNATQKRPLLILVTGLRNVINIVAGCNFIIERCKEVTVWTSGDGSLFQLS